MAEEERGMKQGSFARSARLRIWLAASVIGGLLAALAILAIGAHGTHGSALTPVAAPTVDPRLVIHARTVPITGILAGQILHGTLYPGLPGPNMVRLRLSGSAASLTIVATMPGMAMVPATASLRAGNGVYSGTISLPMFGPYTARLSVGQGGAQEQGTARLNLPLILGR